MFIYITYKATNNGHLYFRRSVILYVNFDMAELAIRTKSPFNYFDTLKRTLCKTLLLLTVSSRLEDSLTHYIYRLWAVKYAFTSSTITHYYYYLADCYFTIDEGIKKTTQRHKIFAPIAEEITFSILANYAQSPTFEKVTQTVAMSPR